MQLGFYVDQTRCVGCFTCVVACKDWHDIRSWGPIIMKGFGLTGETSSVKTFPLGGTFPIPKVIGANGRASSLIQMLIYGLLRKRRTGLRSEGPRFLSPVNRLPMRH